jgi:hypothetical protein
MFKMSMTKKQRVYAPYHNNIIVYMILDIFFLYFEFKKNVTISINAKSISNTKQMLNWEQEQKFSNLTNYLNNINFDFKNSQVIYLCVMENRIFRSQQRKLL